MKTSDILLYGGGAFLLYEFILKPKTTVPVYPPGTVIPPVYNGGILPTSTTGTITSLLGGIVKALGGGGYATSANPAAGAQNAINQYYNSAGADQGIFSTGFNYGSTPPTSTASTGGSSAADQSAYGSAFDGSFSTPVTPVYVDPSSGYAYTDPSSYDPSIDPNSYYYG